MKIKIVQQDGKQHTDICIAVGWSVAGELYSFSDDKTVWKWSATGEPLVKAMDVDTYVTDMHWIPSHSSRGGSSGSGNIGGSNLVSGDVFVAGCADGSIRLIHSSGRVDKIVKGAHRGAVTAVRWNHEGTAFLSGGDDGVIKIWSRGGQHRATLVSTGKGVYSLAWSPSGEHVLYSVGKELIIKPIHSSAKQLQWKAHEGPVTKVDWNALTNKIVSAGEEGKFKVWDEYGRNLFTSNHHEHSIQSVAWSPEGDLFAVGLYNMVKICDKTGWTHAQSRTNTGSILNISWTADGTGFAAAGGNGSVCFGSLLERRALWRHLVATLIESDRIRVHDILNDTTEMLEFRDKVLKMSLGFGHLIVVTASQCSIFDASQWNTPHLFEVKSPVSIIKQCRKHFLLVDYFSGLQVYSYEGRLLSSPKFSGLQTEFLDSLSIALSADTLAVIDRGEGLSKTVRLFDTSTGRQTGQIVHEVEIAEVGLSHMGNSATERNVHLIDRNRDLYIARPASLKSHGLVKLAAMVDSAMWNSAVDILVATGDGKFTTWFYPVVVFVDRDLLPMTRTVHDLDVGSNSSIVAFEGNHCTVRHWNGTNLVQSVSPYPSVLFDLAERNNWEGMIRLCRFVKDKSLWACLAAMSIKAGSLSTAEVALAAIDAVDKLQHILYIQSIPSAEGRNAELALYQRRLDDAEAILRQAGLVYRAIKMHIRLYNWNRALELAVSHKTHVETVLAYRRRYLESVGRTESNPNFLEYETVATDWDKVKEQIRLDKDKERQRSRS